MRDQAQGTKRPGVRLRRKLAKLARDKQFGALAFKLATDTDTPTDNLWCVVNLRRLTVRLAGL